MRKLKNAELNRITVDQFKTTQKVPVRIILDNVRSLNNVGSVFRTSDAFLMEAIYLCGITATPPHNEIHKTALGAEESVQWEYFEDTLDAVKIAQDEGYTVFAIEQAEKALMLDDMDLGEYDKFAFVLGNEVKGVKQEVVDACDHCIELPQYGTKHSLNISITAGIVIWEAYLRFQKLLKP